MKAIVFYMCSNLFPVFSLTQFDTDTNIFNKLAPNNINDEVLYGGPYGVNPSPCFESRISKKKTERFAN